MKKEVIKEAIRLLEGLYIYEAHHEGYKTQALSFDGKNKEFFMEDRANLLVALKKELNNK